MQVITRNEGQIP